MAQPRKPGLEADEVAMGPDPPRSAPARHLQEGRIEPGKPMESHVEVDVGERGAARSRVRWICARSSSRSSASRISPRETFFAKDR